MNQYINFILIIKLQTLFENWAFTNDVFLDLSPVFHV